MKLAIIGGAGVRTPQLLRALLLHGAPLGLTEIAFMDIDTERLDQMSLVLNGIHAAHQHPVKLTFTDDPIAALTGVQYAFFTIRVGAIDSRILDETIPLRHGVLGQETTGPGGFAMALRTVPVIAQYLRIMEEYAPGAIALNLTNPAGLISQAAYQEGFGNILGICDSPMELFKDIADGVGLPSDELWFDYVGINHLGWIQMILHRGQDILPDILQNNEALRRHGKAMIEPEFIRTLGVIPNEYLMFYYNNTSIVRQLTTNNSSRGKMIHALNQRFFTELGLAKGTADPTAAALDVYLRYSRARDATYMRLETEAVVQDDNGIDAIWNESKPAHGHNDIEPEGYSAIAMAIILALHGTKPTTTTVNVLNHNVIPCLAHDDVVEVQARIDGNGVHPFRPIKAIPEQCRGLLQAVKSYERLTVQAAIEQSYRKALLALTGHPLVPDALVARRILDDICAANRPFFSGELGQAHQTTASPDASHT